MTSRSELRIIFDQFAKTAIKKGDDGSYLYGHCIDVTLIDGVWDAYIRNMKKVVTGDLATPLSTRKLNSILATLPESILTHKLSGEAYFKTTDTVWLKSWLWENRKLLGLRSAGHKPAHSIGAINDASRIL